MPVDGKVTVTITIERVNIHHAMFVSPNDHQCIFEMDFLRQESCSIDFAEGTLTIQNVRI